MSWTILYHRNVSEDLESIGPAAARRVMRAIDEKLIQAPLQFGAPLSQNLGGFRKLRIGDYRVVYCVVATRVLVYVLAVGPRRDKEIYADAVRRLE
ncbi:type II toxin-antitoxin system RelE family toxin [Desulfobulbus alkaliphilus]|uniref:type II toxin-antitoxin system RelE family toxin n=1 Tax=Desulfobulbus alkaliphilus TaxID=869814 RepID=UPI0019646541|nr:type II toxin-antitoxin system RelE/ParE family toxin [Desulfobulbus alkaliphilus]MBM9538809.1 type II toxin-antitoxin system RelE/ParE family toxin [Desulfobulbus alkaliphilus]